MASSRGYAAKPIRNLPEQNDVILSVRTPSAQALMAMNAFEPDRVEWHYMEDPKFLRTLVADANSHFVSATLNSFARVGSGAGLAQAIEGNPFRPPWLPNAGAEWISMADRTNWTRMVSGATGLVGYGVGGIQVDDCGFQFAAESWQGGDFSPAAINGFANWVAQNISSAERQRLRIDPVNFDYREYLRKNFNITTTASYLAHRDQIGSTRYWRQYHAETVVNFWDFFVQKLSGIANSPMLSANVVLRPEDFYVGVVQRIDYALSELSTDQLSSGFALAGALMEAIGRPLVGTLTRGGSRSVLRRAYAVARANGIIAAEPWDIFTVQDGVAGARQYPDPSGFTDLTAFVRRNGELLSGSQRSARVGLLTDVDGRNPKQLDQAMRCLEIRNIPMRLLVLGGRFTIPAIDLSGLDAICIPDASLRSKALGLLGGIPVCDLSGSQSVVDQFSVGACEGTPGWSLLPRKTFGHGTIIHIVPDRFDRSEFEGEIRLRASSVVPAGRRFRLVQPGVADRVVTGRQNGPDMLIERLRVADWAILVPL